MFLTRKLPLNGVLLTVRYAAEGEKPFAFIHSLHMNK